MPITSWLVRKLLAVLVQPTVHSSSLALLRIVHRRNLTELCFPIVPAMMRSASTKLKSLRQPKLRLKYPNLLRYGEPYSVEAVWSQLSGDRNGQGRSRNNARMIAIAKLDLLQRLIVTTIDRGFRTGHLGINGTFEIATVGKIFALVTRHTM
jgi:hypothetical protein